MEQFRQIGEVLGSLKALMVLQDDIQINQRQCSLLFEMFTLAFDAIAEEIKKNLKLEERNTKWKPLEEPLRELYRVIKEGELYVRRCLDNKDWLSKAINLHQNKDSLEYHIHNLLSNFPAVIEAIEIVSEISGLDQEEMQKKRVMSTKKYDSSWNDPMLFMWRFGKQYLVTSELCSRFDKAIKEDKWLLVEKIKEKKNVGSLTKNEQRLADLLLKKLNGIEPANGKLPPSSILLGVEDYQVRRRLGGGRSQCKEIQWLGESFVLRHFFEDIEPLCSEISTLLSLSHPNIVQYLGGFYDEEKKECFLIMELMSKDLSSYLKENSSPRRKILFPLPVVVDIMLQIARGIEYLHSQNIYVGELNPTNIFLRPRKVSEGYFRVKVSGFGLRSVKNQQSQSSSPDQNGANTHIWYAPEVLEQHKNPGSASSCQFTEKADVYSFGMVCFELLTGKVPFEDGHLQGDQMMNNIRAGERPLFPSLTPRYLVNLTKKCWHKEPSYRPSFSSICRILRYVKKFLVLNPNDGDPNVQAPLVDYFDLEAGYMKRFPGDARSGVAPVSQIPFEMFAYKLLEKEKASLSISCKLSDIVSVAASNGWDEKTSASEDSVIPGSDTRSVGSDIKRAYTDANSVCTEVQDGNVPVDLSSIHSEFAEKKVPLVKKSNNVKLRKISGKPKAQTPPKPLTRSPSGHGRKMNKDSPKHLSMSPMRPRRKGFIQPPEPEKISI